MRKITEYIAVSVGFGLIPAIWVMLKASHVVSDRLLPSPWAVLIAYQDIEPSIFIHCISTAARLAIGFFFGALLGIGLGIAANWGPIPQKLLLPSLQAVRAIPAAATVPFFLLWFGFSESGRLLLVVLAVATNVAIASTQILSRVPERYAIFFRGFNLDGRRLLRAYVLPTVAARILPTLRFSLALVVGAQTVSELLGAQVGLGYVMQSARATFSMPALFLAMILLGILTAVADGLLCAVWRRIVYWEKERPYDLAT